MFKVREKYVHRNNNKRVSVNGWWSWRNDYYYRIQLVSYNHERVILRMYGCNYLCFQLSISLHFIKK